MRIQNRSPFMRAPARIKSQENEIFLYDEIGFFGIQAQEFVEQLNAIEAGDIHLRINSPGGSVFDGQAIVTAIRQHPANVVAHVDGLAASMAATIAVAADEIRMADGAFMMIHDPWSIVIGPSSEMRREANLLDKIAGSMAAMLAQRSGMVLDQVKGLMAEETWFTAEEAVEAGFADRVDDDKADLDAAARFDLSVFSHVPNEFTGRDQKSPPKELERLLRDAGYSRSEAKAFVAEGRKALNQRDVDEGFLSQAADLAAFLRAGA